MRQVLNNWNGGTTIDGSKISNLRFADDTTLIAASQEELVAVLNILEQHSAAYGLGINYIKTKYAAVKSFNFVCLDSLIDNSGSCENEIRWRIQQACVAMAKFIKLWCDHNTTKATKMSLVQFCVSIFLYASETWTVKKADRARIDAFEIKLPKTPKLWGILISVGVPYHLVFLIQRLYEPSSAHVRIDGNLSGQTATRKGVRQGCVLSPMLFNIYSEFVMRQVLDNWNGGVAIGGSKISNSRFADDTTLIAASQEELVALLNVLEQHSAAYGLDSEHDNHRKLKSVCRCARIDAFEMWTWRRMLIIPYTAHRTNVSVLDELGNPTRLSSIVSMRMLTFFGHIHRSGNMEKLVVQGHAPSGRRRGRSPTR
ncbi:unnamed protein product [Callosobruchus maculatus]|uniref:Reverse transcriptase domain-containing protein n=1 Tax=Callosobruchus maculatus TaxID=64391 RepID=A0A653DHS8_CALMS|nr:unnamed protein product [Callosobruchus maculatus]